MYYSNWVKHRLKVLLPCLHNDGGGMVPRNVGVLPHHYTVSEPRITWQESSRPWYPQV